VKLFFAIVILFSTISCAKKELSSDMFLKPLKKMKEEERKLGRLGPTIDGVTEPFFPDDDENAKSFEGIDSNRDGIRDDVEIWINKMAEDDYVRQAMKDYFRRYTTELKDNFIDKPSEQIISDKKLTKSSFACLEVALQPYMLNFYQRTGKRIANERINMLLTIVINTDIRKKFVKKMTVFQTSGDSNETKFSPDKYCTELMGRYYKETLKKFPILDDSQLPKIEFRPGQGLGPGRPQ
jgi:hypothetical protein